MTSLLLKPRHRSPPLPLPHLHSPPNPSRPTPPSHPPSYVDLLRRFVGPRKPLAPQTLHLALIKLGFARDLFLSNCLIAHYARSSKLEHAHNLFDEIPQRNPVSYNCLISGYTNAGHPQNSLNLFKSMVSDGCLPTQFTLAAALRACQDCGPDRFGFGVQVHGLLAKTQHVSDSVVCNALISMYGSCCLGSSSYARCVFDEMLTKNLISWNSIIGVDSRRGDVSSAFELFSKMQEEGFEPSEHTFGSLIISTYDCGSGNFILDQLLARVSKNGFLSNLYVGSALVSAFARFGVFYKARGVFVQMSEKNAVSMNGLIVGLVKQNRGEEAVEVFRETGDSIEMNSDSYVVLLSAISEFKVPEEGRRMGREVHGFLIRAGLIGIKVAIENGLVNMYAKCCAIEEACCIFEHMRVRDQISWSSIISGLDQNGIFEEALMRFADMLRTGIVPSNFTLISSLSSSADLGLLSSGTLVHAVAMKFGLDLDVSVANSLLKMYGECGSISDCWKVFNSMSDYDLVSWNSMIGLLAKSEESLDRSVGVFLDMMRRGWTPNKVTLINVLSALSPLSVLELGKQVHAQVLKRSISDNNTIDNALISCYAKSGDMDSSEQIFTRM